MSVSTVKTAIERAVSTFVGRTSDVTYDEAKEIVAAATKGSGSAAKVSKDEATLIARVAGQSSFEFAPKGYNVTDAARKEFDAFFAANKLPFGSNAQVMKSQAEAAAAGVNLSKPLKKAPSVTSLYALPLSGGRTAHIDPAKSRFYLQVGTGKDAKWYGPVAMKATTAPASTRDADVAALKSKIETSMKGVLFMSESDYPVEYFQAAGAGAKKPSTLDFLQVIGKPANTPVETRSFKDFFDRLTVAQDWWEPSQKADGVKYTELRKALEANLSDLQVFRVGTIDIGVYVVGRNKYGDLVGVKTTSIET